MGFNSLLALFSKATHTHTHGFLLCTDSHSLMLNASMKHTGMSRLPWVFFLPKDSTWMWNVPSQSVTRGYQPGLHIVVFCNGNSTHCYYCSGAVHYPYRILAHSTEMDTATVSHPCCMSDGQRSSSSSLCGLTSREAERTFKPPLHMRVESIDMFPPIKKYIYLNAS